LLNKIVLGPIIAADYAALEEPLVIVKIAHYDALILAIET